MKYWVILLLLFSIVFKEIKSLTCLTGKPGLAFAVTCTNNSSQCAVASYELLGLATQLSQGCLENCKSGDMISIEGAPISAKLQCCSENYCNNSNNFISQFQKICLIVFSATIALINI